MDAPVSLAARLSPSTLHWSVLTLALPALGEQFLQTLLGLSDLYLAGHLAQAKDMVAAVGMTGQLFLIIQVLLSSVAVGAMALVARHIGQGDRAQADRTARQAMLLGVGIGVAAATVLFVAAPTLLATLGLKDLALTSGIMFTRYLLVGLPIAVLTTLGGACLRGAGDTRGVLIAVGLANIVNIAVAWTLVHGWFGLAPMGLRGIAIGTMTAQIVGGLTMVHLVRSGRRGIRVRFRPIDIQFPLIGRMLRIGWFSGLESLIFTCASTAIAALISHPPMSTSDFAAFVITIRVEALSFLPGFAFGVAGGALVGQSLGAGRPKQATHCGWWAFVWGGLLMSLVGGVFVIWPDRLIHLFLSSSDSAETAAKAISMLRICGYIQPFLGMIMIFAGCLKGAGDTRFPALITFGGVFLYRIPGAFLMARVFRLGVIGVWTLMMSDLVIRGLLCMARFVHGGWKKTRV